ncbi:MAG: HEAT repeat domain-containing protein [Thermodesulfobacteriota bacterium]
MAASELGAEKEVLAQAKDLLNTFIKALKAYRLYPPENTTVQGLKEQVYQKFQSFLNVHHSLILKIGESDISFKDVTLYENRDLKNSLAFLFYKDGIRELRFLEGLEDWEIQDFLDILKQSETLNQLEDDLTTLMWEKNFVHISYVAADIFLEEMPTVIPESPAQFREKLNVEPISPSTAADFGEDDPEIDFYESFQKMRNTSSMLDNRSVYFLTPEELEGLRKEVEMEIAPASVFNVVDILLEILALEKDPPPFQNTVQVLQKILDALISLGEFKKAADLLTRLNIVLNTYELMDWQAKIIQQILVNAGEELRIEKIGKIIDKGEGVNLEEVSSYLLLLRPNAIAPMIKVLGELNNSKARRMLCEVLVELGKNKVELIAPHIEDHRWFLVRNIAYILGRIGKEISLPYMQKALSHNEPRVRREAVQALSNIGGSQVIPLLEKALSDDDPRIRSTAALNMARVGRKMSLPILLKIIQSKEFTKRDAAEVKAFFDAVGSIGDNEAIGPLKKLLEQRSWLGIGRKEDIRLGAAFALAMIGTQEAKEVLEAGKNSRDESIRLACTQALSRKPSKGIKEFPIW